MYLIEVESGEPFIHSVLRVSRVPEDHGCPHCELPESDPHGESVARFGQNSAGTSRGAVQMAMNTSSGQRGSRPWLLVAFVFFSGFLSFSEAQDVIQVRTAGGTTHEMAVVPEGAFEMGFSPSQIDTLRQRSWWNSYIGGLENAQPRHTVHLGAYAIDVFEVTNSKYEAYRAAVGAPLPGGPTRGQGAYREDNPWNGTEHPVSGATWYEARDYCSWAGLRLPTEAEWERAAVGADERLFAWGSSLARTHANYGIDEWCGDEVCYTEDDGDGYYFAAPVGSFPSGRSDLGLFDMTGNVLEWVNDWYLATYYEESPERDPTGHSHDVAGSRGGKVLRGGSYGSLPYQLLGSYRVHHKTHMNYPFFGFRCAAGLQEVTQTSVHRSGWGVVKGSVAGAPTAR